MSRRALVIPLFVSVFGIAVSGPLAAQSPCPITSNGNGATCAVTATVPLAIPKTTRLEISNSSPFSLASTGGLISAADFTAGFYDVASTVTLTAYANATWNVTVKAQTATFAAPCATKPVGNLQWGKTTATRTTPMTTTAAAVFNASGVTPTTGTAQILYFRVLVGWTTDPPSTNCSIGLDFTITSP